MRTLTQPLNMSPGGIPPVIHVSQYDSDFTIVFTLFSTVGDFTIEAGTTAMVRGTKSSGTGYSADATINISAKTVTVTGNQQMTAAAGQNVFEITLLKGGKEISSKNFILLCERAALDADTITDESVLKELNAIIESADTATQAAEEAEDAADRAEAAAQTFVIDSIPTQGSTNAVSSGGVYEALGTLQVQIPQIDSTLSQSGQAADAKVTGDKTTGLKEDLNDSQIVSIVDLTNYIQGYIIASTGAVSTNSNLGRVDGIVLRKGSKVAVTARGYSANIAMIYRCNSDGTYTCLVASDGGSIKTYEYTATENVVVGLSFYVGSYSRDAKVVLAVSDALNDVTPKYNYLIVGTGKQYADIKSAINAVTNPSALNRYVIYVYGGQYNTYDSSQLSSSYKGLILPDYTDIVGIGNRDNIVLYFRGTAETSDYNNNISTLNVGGHNTVENITIIGKHCRYAVHDDFFAHSETEQIYKNVKFLVEAADSSAMASASSNIPYGCGAEIRKKLTFKNCIFENKNNKADFFYHDITAAVMIIGAVITFMNCRFIDGRYSIQLTNYNTPKESRIYLYGCKADNGGFIKGDGTSINTMYISGFANQGFAFTGNGTISQEDIDACIDLI